MEFLLLFFNMFNFRKMVKCEVQCNCTDVNIQIEGGHYNLTKGLETGSLLVYHCPESYYPHPHLIRLCQSNHRWTPAPKRFQPQKCRLVECPDPNVMENGNVSPPQEKYFVDNETTYECYSGYTLRGSSRRVCLPNGKWSGSTPICSRDSTDDCADPGIPAGASRAGNIFGIDDKVTYTCNGNLFLVGSSVRVCQENGQWTGKEPACYYRHTYDTSLEVSEAFGSAIKDSLTVSQPADDIQEGRSIRVSKNGTLNIYIAVDISESIEDEQIKSARDTVIKLIQKGGHHISARLQFPEFENSQQHFARTGDIASFTVSPNYEILFFSAEVFEVVNILDFKDGKIKPDSLKETLENFVIEDRKSGTDLNGVFKTFLERMAIIKEHTKEGFKEHRHVLIIFTDGAYNMGGSPAPTVAKIKNMVYMNHTGEEGAPSREEYLDIYVFAIGAEIFDDDLQPLALGTGGKHYFRMKDIEDLQDTFEEMIDEQDVKGLCGLHKDEKDQIPTRKKYPWWASISVQHTGASQKCLGSLVTPQFILTAAHCFPFGVLPEHITVDINDGQSKVKKVKKITLHPNYNVNAKVQQGIKEFYDYDVALLQLMEDVYISTSVRPICIPCTQETSDALKLEGKSTCRQQEERLFKTELERLNFLTKVDGSVKEKDVHAKLGSNRNECIMHAREAPGIAKENYMAAVTDNFLCTGGQSPYRDHIACKGDSGGAVFKNYELRTVQVALVSWGTKDMCKKGGGMIESDATSRDFHINLFRVVPFLKSVLANNTQDDFVPLQFLED
ncbi:hypothetical protein L3Q82_022239 [Scortum barcoo]|uniref:Uncharacterized protein n=1 Tax=Scortum barcoo TaxID=214431 RepID=A0ACB8X0X9_9TELE|nr:hypothetical protein L3Q82_022239 [Scortum barcoo]